MRLIFAGTPEFARLALARLHEEGHEIAAVLTQPDRPSGRGMKLTPSPVKQLALELGIPVLQPQTLKHPVIQSQLKTFKADVMIVAAYGLLLPEEVLEIPRLGCLNIHASLLPRWRGAAPIQRAIEAGDTETGICIMQMDVGLDTGDILLTEDLPIEKDETAHSLHDKLASLGSESIVYALKRLENGQLTGTPQPSKGVTYAAKIAKEEAKIDWKQPAKVIERQVRAFNPFPGAHTAWAEGSLKIWSVAVTSGEGKPGTVISKSETSITVACGEGAVDLLTVQQAGGKRLSAQTFLVGHPIEEGTVFGE